MEGEDSFIVIEMDATKIINTDIKNVYKDMLEHSSAVPDESFHKLNKTNLFLEVEKVISIPHKFLKPYKKN